MTSPETHVPLLDSVGSLAAGADAWISDIWGVIHNGREAFPAAAQACMRFREGGGTVVLVTNAPYPYPDVVAILDHMEVPRAAWDRIVTSGDVTRALIDQWRGRPVHHLGPDRYANLFAGLDVSFADISHAECVVCTGLLNDEVETPADYAAVLGELAKRKVAFICVNPDIIVERGDRLVYCAGALAQAYEALGGKVAYAGKPYAPIYARARELIAEARGSEVPPARILAIGDGLRTDVAGARHAGLRCLFIGSALHVPHGRVLDAALLGELFADDSHPPVGAMAGLRW